MTTRLDLDVMLTYWKTALGLSDWVMRVKYTPGLPSLGRTWVWWRDREADIQIVPPEEMQREWPPPDTELVLVHELVHIVVDPLYTAAKSERLPEEVREQPVEQLAKAYVRLHRVYPLTDDWLRK